MKFSIVKQPLGPAILSLLLLVILSLVTATGAPAVGDLRLGFSADVLPIAPLGRSLMQFEAVHPSAAAWIAGFVLFITAILLTRLNFRYSLYATNTCVTFPIYAMVMAGALYQGSYLVTSLASLAMGLSVYHLLHGYRNGFGFDHLFRGSAYLGLLIFLEPATAPLVLLIPLATASLQRTAREGVVAVGGFLLPFAVICYLNWAYGGSFTAPVEALYAALIEGKWLGLILGSSTIDRAFFITLNVITAFAALLFLANSYTLSNKARHILLLICRLWLLQLTLFCLPSATINLLGVMAIPCTLLIPVVLIRTHHNVAQLLYLFLFIVTICAIFR